jgi:DNA-binding transcriptional ArsR family regulator
VGIDQNTVSHHLGRLKLLGLVHARRKGKHTLDTATPGRVRVDRGPGQLALTVTHANGVSVTLAAPVLAPAAPRPATCKEETRVS